MFQIIWDLCVYLPSGYLESQFQLLLLFKLFTVISKVQKSGLCIITYFWCGQYSSWEFLPMGFIKSWHLTNHLLVLAIFPHLGMIGWWSASCMCQVWRYTSYFGHVQNFGQYLSFSFYFVNSESVLLVAFVKYALSLYQGLFQVISAPAWW